MNNEKALNNFFRAHLSPATNRDRKLEAEMSKAAASAFETLLERSLLSPKLKRRRIHRRRKSRAKARNGY
jgi:hypothetical protein